MESVLNGRIGVERIAGSKGKPRSKGKPAAKSGAKGKHLQQVEVWAGRYVVLACVLSSGLNAWANVDLCGNDSPLAQGAAGFLGAVVPVLVWLLGKVAGHAHRAGRLPVCWLVGAAGVALLMLSVWHCAHAIQLLTGGGLILSLLMSLGIDYGLVASEVAAIVAHQE